MKNINFKSLISVAALALGMGFASSNVSAQQNFVYQIESAFSGKCLDVAGASTADGANINIWECNGQANQRFEAVPVGDGSYQLVSQLSGKCLDVSGYNQVNGARLVQWPCQGDNTFNQSFWLMWEEEGYYSIRPVHSGKCIDVWGWVGDDGQANTQWDCLPQSNQRWNLIAAGTGTTRIGSADVPPGNYELVSILGNKCLDIAGNGINNGTNVQTWSCLGATSQTIALVDSGNGFRTIRLTNSWRRIDIGGSSTEDADNALQWDCKAAWGKQ